MTTGVCSSKERRRRRPPRPTTTSCQHVRRGSYQNERDLIDAIGRFVAGTKAAEHVLAKAIKDQPTSGTGHWTHCSKV